MSELIIYLIYWRHDLGNCLLSKKKKKKMMSTAWSFAVVDQINKTSD